MPSGAMYYAFFKEQSLEQRHFSSSTYCATTLIHWAQWAPADYLQKLSEGFTAETGIKVIVEQTPWETFVQKYNVEMVAKSDAWDIIVGDSQDLGTMATGGHYVELTDWVKEHGVDKTFTAASMMYYGEYPKGTGKYSRCICVENMSSRLLACLSFPPIPMLKCRSGSYAGRKKGNP